jgi:hypothetical protein
MESTANVIPHPAQRHRTQGHEDHVTRFSRTGSRVFTQEEQQFTGPRKLRRLSEPAAPTIECDREFLDRTIESVGRRDRPMTTV